MHTRSRLFSTGLILLALLLALTGVLFSMDGSLVVSAQAPTGTPGAATAGPTTAVTVTLPTIPPPLAVQVDPKTTALLILDVTNFICSPRPNCVATVPADAALLKKARDAGALVVYSDTSATSTILPDVAPGPNDPRVTGRADKFFNTTLDDTLKGKGVKTVVIVGYVGNGAVLYTAFGANVRGYTVVVPVDGTGADDPFVSLMTYYQLLNEPGFANPANQALIESRVALSRSDLLTFAAGAPPPQPVPTATATAAGPVSQVCPPFTPPAGKPSGFIGNVTMALGTQGDTKEPVNPTTTFPPNSVFHAVVATQNAPANTKYTIAWFATDIGAPGCNISIDSTDLSTDGNRNIDFTLTPKTVWPNGAYRVEILVNDVLDRVVTFNVSGTSAPTAATATPAATATRIPPTPTAAPVSRCGAIPAGQGGLLVTNFYGQDMNYEIGGKRYTVPGNGQQAIFLPPGKQNYSADIPGVGRAGGTLEIQEGVCLSQPWAAR